jgi:hypothetical protein
MAGLEVAGVQDAEDVSYGVMPGKAHGMSLSVRFSIDPGADPGHLLPCLRTHIRSRLLALTGTLPAIIDVALTQGCWPRPTEPSRLSRPSNAAEPTFRLLPTPSYAGLPMVSNRPLTRRAVEAVVTAALGAIVDQASPDQALPDQANPGYANLDQANLDQANLDQANLDQANLEGAEASTRPIFSHSRIRVDEIEPLLSIHLSLMVPYGLALPEAGALLCNFIRTRINDIWPSHPIRLVVEYRDLALENA